MTSNHTRKVLAARKPPSAHVPGGIDVTVQSWLADDTNFAYDADGIRHDFFLPSHHNDQDQVADAKATLNFPGVPPFRNWKITITCQNGKSLMTSHWY